MKVGTFIRAPEDGIDLYSFKGNRFLKLGDTFAELYKSDHLFNDVEMWLKSNDLENIRPYIEDNGIKALKDLKLHTEAIINSAFSDKVINDFEEAKKIRSIFNDIDPAISGRKKKYVL